MKCLIVIGFFVFAFAKEETGSFEEDYFEGDIMLRPGENFLDRNAMRDRNFRWPGRVVYYQISANYTIVETNLIQEAMREFENNSCIRFEEGQGQGAYVQIEPVKGCRSFMGRSGKKQTLSLTKPGCMEKGIIMHELMHSLGFIHEQALPNRDKYVTIHWENIQKGEKENFETYRPPNKIDDMKMPYDYFSLMHYRAWEFAINESLPTISSKQSGITLDDLGSAKKYGRFTKIDIEKLNKYYEC